MQTSTESIRTEATTYWDPERDRPRGVPLTRLEIHNRKTLNLQLPRGWLAQPGVQTIEVYADEVENVQSQVEPRPEAIAQAHDTFRRALADEAKARVDGFSGDAEQFLKRVDAGDPVCVEAYEFVRARTPLSPEGMFRQTMMRDPLPLVSVRVLEASVPEPKREAVKIIEMENSKSRGELGAAIGDAIAEAQKPLLAMIQQLLQSQGRNHGGK